LLYQLIGKYPILFVDESNRSKTSRRVSRATIKDAISDAELLLYRQALQRQGNDWRKILEFFVQHKDVLPEVLNKKYTNAFRNIDNKDAVKPIRNRLANICRRVRNAPEVREREERNAESMKHMTTEDLIVKMKDVKAWENDDPLCNVSVVSSEPTVTDQPGSSYTSICDEDVFQDYSSGTYESSGAIMADDDLAVVQNENKTKEEDQTPTER